MCTGERRSVESEQSSDGTKKCNMDDTLSEKAYLQLRPDCKTKATAVQQTPAVWGKVMFVATVVALVLLSHAALYHQWALPWFYAVATPILVFFKTLCYWKNKWQFFMIDFCYTANTLLLVYLGLPQNEYLFRVVFALTTGPVLMAAVVYKNSLVFHNYDKVTSSYIHLLPATLTFCARWSPVELSGVWFKPFIQTAPEFDLVWLYAVPFACFFLHSCCYCLIVNIIVRPKDPYLTSYKYLAVKYEKLNVIKGPMGHAIAYYGFNWLFCLTSLLVSLLAYSSFLAHCLILVTVFTVVLYNGAGYYMHMFSKLPAASTEES